MTYYTYTLCMYTMLYVLVMVRTLVVRLLSVKSQNSNSEMQLVDLWAKRTQLCICGKGNSKVASSSGVFLADSEA